MSSINDPFYTVKDRIIADLSKSNPHLSSIEDDVTDLLRTCKIVRENRQRFPHITDEELRNRLEFLKDISTKLKRLTSPRIENKGSEIELSESHTLGEARMQQDQLYAQQDEILIDMGDALSRLQAIGTDIGTSLKEQSIMLDETEADMTGTISFLDVLQRKMDKLLHASDKSKWCMIGVLLCVAVVLLFVILYL